MRRSRSRPARSLGAAWSPRPLRPRTATAGPYRLRRRRRAGWTRTRSRADLSSSVSSLVLPARLPARERALDPLQREIQDQRQDGDDDDPADHPGRVEECLRRRDPPAQSGVGADGFGDDRAREGEAGAGPQARNDRAEGCREQHLEGHVAAPGPEHADVVHERLVDVAHRGEGREEDDEEHERHAERHLAREVDAEREDEDRRENEARDRVEHREERIERLPEELIACERVTDRDAEERAYRDYG